MLKKKIWPNFSRIIEVFTQKIVTKPLKIWVWDQGSEIQDPEKTYSGSRIQGSKMHRIPDPQHCCQVDLKGEGESSRSACCTRPLQATVEGEEHAKVPFSGQWQYRNFVTLGTL
jgi:hypothetical protein